MKKLKHLFLGIICALSLCAISVSAGPLEQNLHKCVEEGNLKGVAYWIEKGADVNCIFGGKPLLVMAVEHGNYEIAKCLIEHKANVDCEYYKPGNMYFASQTTTPLKLAVQNQDLRIIGLLIANNADLNFSGMMGFGSTTPLMLCPNNPELFRSLIKYGADPTVVTDDGYTVLMQAAKIGLPTSDLEYIIGKGVDVNAKNKLNLTALIYAIACDNTDCADFLIKKGADINALKNLHLKSGRTGNCPQSCMHRCLCWAIENDKTDIFNCLIKNGAKLDIFGDKTYNFDCFSLIFQGNYRENPKKAALAKYLIANSRFTKPYLRALLNTTTEPYLGWKVINNRVDKFKFLIENGVDINTRLNDDPFGYTLLMEAVFKDEEDFRYSDYRRHKELSNREIIEYLLNKGADVNLKGRISKDDSKESALSLAKIIKYRNEGLYQLIKDAVERSKQTASTTTNQSSKKHSLFSLFKK